MSDATWAWAGSVFLVILTNLLGHYLGRQKRALEAREIDSKILASATDVTGKLMKQIEELVDAQAKQDERHEKEIKSLEKRHQDAVAGLLKQMEHIKEESELRETEYRFTIEALTAQNKDLDARLTRSQDEMTIILAENQLLRRENQGLREKLARLEPLEQEVVQLRAEVAQLKAALTEAQDQMHRDELHLRNGLNAMEDPNDG